MAMRAPKNSAQRRAEKLQPGYGYPVMAGYGIGMTKWDPVPGYPKSHPFNSIKNHQKLHDHVFKRMQLARETQNAMSQRCRNIDTDINGFLKLTDEDKQRRRDNLKGKSPKPTDIKLPLAIAKVEDLLTFMMEVFFPNSGMHAAYSGKGKQDQAKAFSLLMNKHGERFSHYRYFSKFIFDALKYNFAGLLVEWYEENGNKIVNAPLGAGPQIKKDQMLFAGNRFLNMDMYNFYWDVACNPPEIPKKGEWFAYVQMETEFTVKKRTANKDYEQAAVDRILGTTVGTYTYYNERPVVRFDYDGTSAGVNWFKFAGREGYGVVGKGYEILHYYTWINPKQYGLSQEDEFQIWRLTFANSSYLIDAERMNNAHAMLPLVIAMPNEDNLDMQRKSPAEEVMSLNDFASFLINVHQAASRKKIWGLQIYDPNIVDLSTLGSEPVGRVPVKQTGFGKDITKAVFFDKDATDTSKTMEDVKNIVDLLEVILPTNQIKQVADLDRATEFQAAATVQGSNRKNYKMARLIADQAIVPMRFMMLYNILQFQPNISIIAPDGTEVPVDTTKFRDMDIEFEIGEGLQSMDRMVTSNLLKEVINSVLQNQQAAQEIDIVALLNFYTDQFGLKYDLNNFRRTTPTPEQQAAAADIQSKKVGNVVDLASQAHTQSQPPANGAAR